MRGLLKAALISLTGLLLVLGTVLGWLFLYSRDLPDMKALSQFAPKVATTVSDPCLGIATVAIPHDSIGSNLRVALMAVEGSEDGPSVLEEATRAFRDQRGGIRALSSHISRTMFCIPAKATVRLEEELRTALQLERHYSRRELFTIFANRLYFGENVVGVEEASQHYFHKDPDKLLVEEAALLAGLVKAPAYFSPTNHPDRALKRRNEVIDAMVAARALLVSEAEAAKARPLQVATN